MCKIVRPQKIYVAKYYEINKKFLVSMQGIGKHNNMIFSLLIFLKY